jgi:malonyl-CoA O-methyltransferase
VELDFAFSMLLRARTHETLWRRGLNALRREYIGQVCADMEHLPFGDDSFDMVWSNMAPVWASDPQQMFAEAWRVLRPGGVCMFGNRARPLGCVRLTLSRSTRRVN